MTSSSNHQILKSYKTLYKKNKSRNNFICHGREQAQKVSEKQELKCRTKTHSFVVKELRKTFIRTSPYYTLKLIPPFFCMLVLLKKLSKF